MSTPPTGTLDMPNNSSDDTDGLYRKILAFRQTVAMLAKVLQTTLVKQTDMKKPGGNEWEELRISNSFCAVAIVDHDIIAVATKTHPGVSIFTCNHPTNETDVPPWVSISQPWDFLFTKNYCRSDPKPQNPIILPIIIKPMAPACIDPENSREIITYYLKSPQWVHFFIFSLH